MVMTTYILILNELRISWHIWRTRVALFELIQHRLSKHMKRPLTHSKVVTTPTPPTYSLHKKQGQLLGIHFLISHLNFSNVCIDLNLFGSMSSHTIGPKYLTDSFPLWTVLTFGLRKVLSLLVFKSKTKRSLIMSGPSFLATLNISVASSWTLRWWIVTELSFFNNSSNTVV